MTPQQNTRKGIIDVAAWLQSSLRHCVSLYQYPTKKLSNKLLPFIEVKQLPRESIPGGIKLYCHGVLADSIIKTSLIYYFINIEPLASIVACKCCL